MNGVPTVLFTKVARHFQKRHTHILRVIDRLRSLLPKTFIEPNLGRIETPTKVGFGTRNDKTFLLTRDALSLLVMGVTGKAVIMWKLRYIEAFNEMETSLREGPQRQVQALAGSLYTLTPAKKRRLRSAVRFRKLGLGIRAIAKQLDSDAREISRLLKAATVLGFLAPATREVDHA